MLSTMIEQSNSCFACHTMLLKENGDLYSFGYNGYGQCGIGNQEDVYTPTMVMNNTNIRSINLGVWNSFLLERNGDLYGCGYNYKGELGLGNCENKSKFNYITNGVKKVCASRYFTIIQKYDSKVYYSGEISNGCFKTFTEIEIEDVVQFSAGEYHLLLLKKNGDLFGMGLSRYGELLSDELNEFKRPTLLMNEKNVVAICSALYQNFILTKNDDGTLLKTFGKENEFYGDDRDHKHKILEIRDHKDIKSIHTGSNCCFLLKENGQVYSSGHNNDGQLSLSNNNSSYGFKKTSLENISHIVAGYHNTMFIDYKKQIFNCGNGGSGKLGVKYVDNRNVAGMLEFKDVVLVNNNEFTDEWMTDIHKTLPPFFRSKVKLFLLFLKRRKGGKVPRPIQHIIIKMFYHLSFYM